MNSKAIRKQLLAAVAMVLVAAVALGSSTYAWFVNNNKVTAEMTTISAASSTASLYIETGAQTTVPTSNKTSTTTTGTGTLVPVSNNFTDGALGDWYIVNSWNNSNANGYAKLSGTDAVTQYDYKLTQNGQTLQGATIVTTADTSKRYSAYNVGHYTIYTASGTQDVYLDPVTPITVTEGTFVSDRATVSDETPSLSKAIRIAVVATTSTADEEGTVTSSTQTLYYLPERETKTGNDAGSATTGTPTTTVYKVDSASSIAAITAGTDTVKGYFAPDVAQQGEQPAVKSIGYWTATDNGNGSYSAGTIKLGTAGDTAKTMLDVKVYVWLEGTDGECLVHNGVDGVQNLSVNLKFVGVDPTT